MGRLSALICADSGYLETYVANVKALPLEQLEGFSWLEGPGAPYR